jgi:hypothetical protein
MSSGTVPPRPVVSDETPTRPAPVGHEPNPASQQDAPPPVVPAPAPATQQSAQNPPPPPPPPVNPMLPRRPAAPSAASAAGLADMLELTAPEATRLPVDMATSYFLPSYIALGKAVDACNHIMLTTRKFTESNPQWHPLLAHAYIAFCWYTKILATMAEDGELSDDQLGCYLRIRETINTEGLWIPGPLVPYFESISLSAGPHGHQGNVCPQLPPTPEAAAPNAHLILPATTRRHLPHVLSLLNQAQQIGLSSQNATNPVQLGNPTHLYGVVATAAATQFADTFCGPTYRSRTFTPQRFLTNYNEYYLTLQLPTFTAANMTSTSPPNWSQFLGLTSIVTGQRSIWITEVATIMQSYCTFFRGSQALLAIPIVGFGAGQVEVLFSGTTSTDLLTDPNFVDAVAGPPAVPAHYERAEVNTFEAKTRTRNPHLPVAGYQMGSLTRVNAILTGATSPRTGLAWQNAPFFRSGLAFDYLVNLGPLIASKYHSSVPIRRE